MTAAHPPYRLRWLGVAAAWFCVAADASAQDSLAAPLGAPPAPQLVTPTPTPSSGDLAAQLDAIRTRLEMQQLELQEMRGQLHERDLQIEAVRRETRLQSGPEQLARAAQEPPKKSPASVTFKGVTLTPGGFAAAETLFRSKAENSDMISSFSGIPYHHDPRSQLTEFRGSARQSRLSLLAEGQAGRAKISGYWEMDFLGAAPTANENQASGFTPRQRLLFAEIALDTGWTVSAGQTWSLITLNERGTGTRTKWSPATIDAQYVVGYDFARLYTARVAKTFDDERWTVAVAAETPATLVGGSVPKDVSGVPGGVGSAGVTSLGNGVNYATGLAPDVIAKITNDTRAGHFELKGLMRSFRDHVVGGDRHAKVGGGIGGGLRVPVWPQRVQFVAQGLWGYGVARYHDSGTADLVVRPNGSLQLVQSGSALAGFEVHVLPKVDVYGFGGTEYQGRTYGMQNGTAYGYGNPGTNLSGCLTTSPSFMCTADYRDLVQAATGVWYKPFAGDYGSIQVGLQYSYTVKHAWSGLTADAGSPSTSPKGTDHMAFTSLRYNIP